MVQGQGRFFQHVAKGALLAALSIYGCTVEQEPEVSTQTQACTQSPADGVFAHAYRGILLKKNSYLKGQLEVREVCDGDCLRLDTEITLDQHAKVEGGLKADTIRLKQHVRVDGPVQGNELIEDKHVSLGEPFTSPLDLPLSDITPALPPFQPGSQAITVDKKKTETLAPGSYGSVLLKKGSHHHPTTLKLEGGVYDFLELVLHKHSRLICLDTCQIQIKQRLSSNQHVTIGPKPGAELSAKDVRIFVDGQNGAGSTVHDQPKAAKLGYDNMVIAHIVVPHGTFWLRRQSTMRGVAIARWIILGQKVKAAVEDPLSPPTQDGGMTDGSLDGPKDAGPSDTPSDTAADAPTDTATDAPADSAPDAPADTFFPVEIIHPDTCVPTTCSAQGKNCGSIPDNCGGTLSCGICTAPETCGGAGEPNLCGCTPSTCAAEGKNCDTITDNCGGVLDCGLCAPPETCGGAGQANVCGCTPTTCAAEGKNCGTISDGCGSTLSCGACIAPATCGGAGEANVCGCTPTTCTAEGKNCDTISDGCGGVLNCGICAPPEICGGAGEANVCGCTPTTCAAEGKNCGAISDNCGGLINCGDCSATETCGGSGEDNVCGGCIPTTCAAEGKECGAISDGCGLTLDCGSCPSGQGCGWGGMPNVCGGTPPDPTAVAPDTDPTLGTTLFDSISFLYSGASPIQSGVAPGAIERRRVALIRGRVLDVQGSPLSGVNVAVLGHPELGHTATRVDGWFDLAVNGGDPLVVSYSLAGHLPLQRHVQLPWQGTRVLDDVVMTALDSNVTTISAGSGVMQIARGSMNTDGDGSRQATLLFARGTAATMTLADGSTQALSTMAVRITEYTVGENGPAAMPAALPKNVAYTYAVEFSVDQALAQGATRVDFSSPVVNYTENFLGFPVGTAVPVGFYDHQKASWYPSENGRVVQILSAEGGLASLDIQGDGQAASEQDLTELGVSLEERQQLAQLYAAGQSLWRVAVTHFSTCDQNWTFGFPFDVVELTLEDPETDEEEEPDCPEAGSLILCKSQVLGEAVPIAGTPYNLHYRSSRVRGKKGAVKIHLSGETIPTSLKRIDLQIDIAGRRFWRSYAPQPNLSHTFVWDGEDQYGRRLQGSQWMDIEIRHVYNGIFYVPPIFGGGGELPLPRETRSEIYMSTTKQVLVDSWDARTQGGLGGWTVDVAHAYDLAHNIVYFGDGSRRSGLRGIPPILTTAAGNGFTNYGDDGDGGPALEANLNYVKGIAVDGAGQIYLADDNRVRKVGVDGVITTVAGVPTDPNNWEDPTSGYNGDERPAYGALLNGPAGLATDSWGNLFIADQWNGRVRKVDSEGAIHTVAGNGDWGFAGDFGPATDASFEYLKDVEVDEQGNLYLIDGNRIRKVSSDGTIYTISGTGDSGFSGDGGPAVDAELETPLGLAVDRQGNLYIAGGHRVRKIRADGIITTVAGAGSPGFSGDGGQASLAALDNPTDVEVDGQGNLYISDYLNNRVRKVGTDGVIITLAGNGDWQYAGDNGPATAAGITPGFLAVDGRGYLFVNDLSNSRLMQTKVAVPGVTDTSATTIAIPSADGRLIHRFVEGRHVSTLRALTGAALLSLTYDSRGLLEAITDGDGDVTTIQRSASGNPMAILAPFGQVTGLTLDANGYLASITNPANETVQLAYDEVGLLTSLTDPRTNTTYFTYDERGRLLRDPAGHHNYQRSGLLLALRRSLPHLFLRHPGGPERLGGDR